MKTVYVAIIWLAMFQMTALTIGSLGVFPSDSTLYSDFDTAELEENAGNPVDVLAYIFLPSDVSIAGITGAKILSNGVLLGVIFIIVGIGTGAALLTGQYTVATLAVVGLTFIPMITKSLGFFQKLFMHWDTAALTYMGIQIALGVVILLLLLIVELPAQGGS